MLRPPLSWVLPILNPRALSSTGLSALHTTCTLELVNLKEIIKASWSLGRLKAEACGGTIGKSYDSTTTPWSPLAESQLPALTQEDCTTSLFLGFMKICSAVTHQSKRRQMPPLCCGAAANKQPPLRSVDTRSLTASVVKHTDVFTQAGAQCLFSPLPSPV